MNIHTYLNTLQLKGFLAYEYNPFLNYLTKTNLKEYNGFLIPEEKAIDKRNGRILTKGEILRNGSPVIIWKDDEGNIIDDSYIISYDNIQNFNIITKDSLINLDTLLLNFDINHPINIEVLPSYDGSVNLILNDGKNTPRLINSRFSKREKNTYEIVDRIGENDTNIYSSDSFEKDTSLYFLYKTNPKIDYRGFVSGSLLVGQYCFYFTYCDSDGNESDFIAESGLIPVFIGIDKDPYSMDGGIKNQSSNKGIQLRLTKLDSSYNYLKVYYVRYFADYLQNRVYECKKIYLKYAINSNKINIQITGNEEAEDLDPNILNAVRFNSKGILTLAQCKNMLFFGNIVKNSDNYKELQDCALRIVPTSQLDDVIDIDNNYNSNSSCAYYNSFNMYSKVGYYNNEYYRFGVVFIYENGTLSNVYNTIGYDTNNSITYLGNLFDSTGESRKYIKIDDEGWVINQGEFTTGNQLNARGVCKIKSSSIDDNLDKIIKIKFSIPKEVSEYLSTLGIRGMFFVRQKRIPNILGQCYILPMDKILEAPILKLGEKYYTESFVSQGENKEIGIPGFGILKTIIVNNSLLTNDYSKRLYEYKNLLGISINSYAAICPDFLLNQAYYNQIFNGSKFKLQKATNTNSDNSSLLETTTLERYYKEKEEGSLMSFTDNEFKNVKICSVTEEVPTIAIDKNIFRLEAGKAEEAYRFKYALMNSGEYNVGEEDFDKINNATNIVRGKYSPYLAISGNSLEENTLYNIYQDSYIEDDQLYLTRMNSLEPFYAISDRLNWEDLELELDLNNNLLLFLECFRGDCYTNVFTYRLNRNFNDSSLPNNDQIIDKKTWKDNYKAEDPTKFKDISRSDVNAVQLGSWITIKVKSAYNYALRSEDFSYVSENALMGSPRTFYPRKLSMWLGNYKLPDSYLYNDAYRASLGYKCYFTILDTNYIKDTFSNRILYSAMAIQDSFKNNYRESYSTYFRDYSLEYGSILKLVGFEGYLLVVFEHAIGIAVINERVLVGNGDGEPVFINTKNVLPEELTIVTDTYGTQWPESVIKSEAGYVYGVDTIAKKIWRVKGQNIEILSDFKVNKFLIENITLGERELYPIVGIKNVKTHYNNNKKDIMFTFYDDIYKDEEKVWNLCYNELLNLFITFYSWVPSYSENIDTQFFSFDRKTSKALSLLDQSNYANNSNIGVLLNSPIMYQSIIDEITGYYSQILYRNPSNNIIESNIEIDLVEDHWGYYKYFSIVRDLQNNMYLYLPINKKQEVLSKMEEFRLKVIILYLLPTLYINTLLGNSQIVKQKPLQLAISFEENIQNLTTDFYLHGLAGIFNIAENLYPTHWYGEYHPFEFEFVVNDKIGQQKIFTNLEIISNKAEPESFHFEIEGDNYEFSSDKRNMYFRLEATKNVYQNLGSDILYDRKFTDVAADSYTYELYYRKNSEEYTDQYLKFDKVYPVESLGLTLLKKSTIFPLYYEKIDTFNDIYFKYREMIDSSKDYDFKNLSGSEIKWDRDLNQFNIVTHIKNSPVNLVGRLRGNSYYKEGKWNIQIPSIIFSLKNEEAWDYADNDFILNQSRLNGTNVLANYPANIDTIKLPPIVINSQYLPSDITSNSISNDTLPNIYSMVKQANSQSLYKYIDTKDWTRRKEARIRDKWIKIRVRYSGKNLAVIHSLITLYNISYS